MNCIFKRWLASLLATVMILQPLGVYAQEIIEEEQIESDAVVHNSDIVEQVGFERDVDGYEEQYVSDFEYRSMEDYHVDVSTSDILNKINNLPYTCTVKSFDGTTFTANLTAKSSSGATNSVVAFPGGAPSQCMAYANELYYYLFGTLFSISYSSTGRTSTGKTNIYNSSTTLVGNLQRSSYSSTESYTSAVAGLLKQAVAGDVIAATNGSTFHFMVVMYTEDTNNDGLPDRVHTAEGNYDGNDHIAINYTRNLSYFTSTKGTAISLYRNTGVTVNKDPDGVIDVIEGGDGTVHVKGWVYDPDTLNQSVKIHVYVGGKASPDVECHVFTANQSREDVQAAYKLPMDKYGFNETFAVDPTGDQEVYVYAINTEEGNNPCLGHKVVNIRENVNVDPEGVVDVIEGGYGTVRVKGWAYDPNTPNQSIKIHVYVGGKASPSVECHTITANLSREDVQAAYKLPMDKYGFNSTFTVSPRGNQEIYVYAINTQTGNNPCIGKKTVNIQNVDISATATSVASATATAKANATATSAAATATNVAQATSTGYAEPTSAVTPGATMKPSATATATSAEEPRVEETQKLLSRQTVNISRLFSDIYGTIKYQSNNKKVISVKKNGDVKAKKAGNAIVTAYRKTEYGKYVPVGTVYFVVEEPKLIKMQYTTDTASYDANTYLSGTKEQPTVWKSTNTSVATVDANGTVTILKKGSTTIFAYFGDGTARAKAKLTVKKGFMTTSGSTPTPTPKVEDYKFPMNNNWDETLMEYTHNAIADHYQKLINPDGRYVVFDFDDVQTNDSFKTVLRFQSNQPTTSANVYVMEVIVDKTTGKVTDEFDTDVWYLDVSELNRK